MRYMYKYIYIFLLKFVIFLKQFHVTGAQHTRAVRVQALSGFI